MSGGGGLYWNIFSFCTLIFLPYPTRPNFAARQYRRPTFNKYEIGEMKKFCRLTAISPSCVITNHLEIRLSPDS